MFKLNNIKQNILILYFATFLSGCGGGGTSTSTETTASTFTNAVQSGQISNSVTGEPLANVKVSIGDSITITDTKGFYTLFDLTENEEAVVNFEKEGYLLGSTQIQIKSLSEDNTASDNYLEYGMHAHDKQWNYDSTKEFFSTNVTIGASVAYIDTEGNPYIGTITADLSVLDTTTDEGKALFPGTFKGINSNGMMVQFSSYGLISISIKDSHGDRLSFADNATATLVFDAISSIEEQSIIPLWYYDYEQGLWIEEGYAELQVDGTYKGEISHQGTWNLSKPLEDDPGIYRARIVYGDGTPVHDVRIHAIGDNWSSSDLSTDENGIFELEVIPDSSFQLKAYNYKDKYSATYANTLPAISSGEIVEDRM